MHSAKRGEMDAEAIKEPQPSRRHRSAEEKQRIVEASFAAGTTVTEVAQEHGVRASQVYQWRKQLGRRRRGARKALAVNLLPVAVATEASKENSGTASAVEVMEIELPKGRMRIVGADANLVRAALEMLR